jgi:outer membrane protein assembly factor BamB/tetratricopeptide (TPR) repeat protein
MHLRLGSTAFLLAALCALPCEAQTADTATAGSLRLPVSRQAPLWWESARRHLEQGQTAAAVALLDELQREAANQFVVDEAGTSATANWLIQRLAERFTAEEQRAWETAIAPAAQAAWNRWQTGRQRDDLALLCRSYSATEPGLRAWQALAAIHRDEGRCEHALMAFDAVFRHRRASRSERAEAFAAQGALWQKLGRPDRVRDLWTRHQREWGSTAVQRAGKPTTVAALFERWLTSPSPNGLPNASHPALRAAWTTELAPAEKLRAAWEARWPEFRAAGAWTLPAFEPVVSQSLLLTRTPTGLAAIDESSGEVRWQSLNEDLAWLETTPGRLDNRNTRNWLIDQFHRRANADSILGRITIDDRHVYAIQDPLGLTPEASLDPSFRPVEAPSPRFNTLSALRIADGELAWRVGGKSAGPTYPLGSEFFCGPPTAVDDMLYIIGQQKSELRLLALQADHGELVWRTVLGEAPRNVAADPLRQRVACPVIPYRDVLLCPTAAGAIVAVDPLTHTPRWAYRYPVELRVATPDPRVGRTAAAPDAWWNGWRDISIHAVGDVVVFCSPETSRLHALDVGSGRARWTMPRAEGLVLLGANAELVIVGEPTAIRAHRLETGEVAWRTPIGELTGRGVISGGQLLVPTQPHGLAVIDLGDGALTSLDAAGATPVLGNLVRSDIGWLHRTLTAAARLHDRAGAQVAANRDGQRLSQLAELKQNPERWPAAQSLIDELSETPAQRLEFALAVGQAAAQAGAFADAAKVLLDLVERTPRDQPVTLFNPRRNVRADLVVLAAWDDFERAASPVGREQLAAALREAWRIARDSQDPFAAQRWWEQWRPLRSAQPLQASSEGRVFLGQPMAAVELALLATADRAAHAAAVWQLAEELSRAGFHRDANDYRRTLLRDEPGTLVANGVTISTAIAERGGLTPVVDPWPLVTPSVEVEKNPGNDSIHHAAVPLDPESTVLFDGLDVTIDRQGRRLRFSGGGQRGAWELPLPPSTSSLRYVNYLVQGWGRGRVLVLRVGTELFAVTPFDDRGEPVARVLWTLNTQESGSTSQELLSEQMLPAVPGIRDDELRLIDGFGRAVAQVGPVRAGSVCYHDNARLVSVETLTGRKRWERFDLPLDAATFGDDETIVIWSLAEQRLELVRALDGTTLGQRDWQATPDDVVLQRDRRAWWIVRSRAPRLICEDVVTGEVAWSHALSAGGLPFLLDGRTLGVVDPRGVLEILAAEDGAPLGEALTVDLPTTIERVAVSRDAERWYVVFSERTAQQAALKQAQMRQGHRTPIVTGPLYAIDRDGPFVRWRIDLDREAWPVDQPRSIPVLWQAYATPARQGPNFSTWTPAGSVLRLRDKRTGQDALYRDGLGPTPYTTLYGDPDRGVIDVLMERDSFRLRYRPAPPPPSLPDAATPVVE